MQSIIFKTSDLSSNDRERIEKKSIEKLGKIFTSNLNDVRNNDYYYVSEVYFGNQSLNEALSNALSSINNSLTSSPNLSEKH
jgi:hypothetical protein